MIEGKEKEKICAGQEVLWINEAVSDHPSETVITKKDMEDAKRRLKRFAPYLQTVFAETRETNGIIESPLREIRQMKAFLNETFETEIQGRLYLKMDSHLPIAGSVKARGGIYEVLKHAEELAIKAGLLKETDDYSCLAEEKFRDFFAQYKVQVGSTGNLGLSIGIMSAKLGFQVIVHMSKDAKQWKKDLLRSKGVTVIEYEEDYGKAVEEGRKTSKEDEKSYFVDDENSIHLFLGYATAGERLKRQLEEQHIAVDETHPLFVYLPCGIGGAPGGIAYGLKEQFGKNVHCFFIEPTEACCMLLGMATGKHDQVSVWDFGISGKTEADGLAVGRSSAFVGRIMEERLSGIATIKDDTLYRLMKGLKQTEDLFIEPSACAAFGVLLQRKAFAEYRKAHRLEENYDQATHIVWATGGNLVPEDVREAYMRK